MATRRTKGFQPVKHPGAATRKAKAEGLSLHQWEEKHKNDPGQTGKQARFPLIAKKWHHGGKKKVSVKSEGAAAKHKGAKRKKSTVYKRA
jgi:hypothetical protein